MSLYLLLAVLLGMIPAVAAPAVGHAAVLGAVVSVTVPTPVPLGSTLRALVTVQVEPATTAQVRIYTGNTSFSHFPDRIEILPQTVSLTAGGGAWSCFPPAPNTQAMDCTHPASNEAPAPIEVTAVVDGDQYLRCDEGRCLDLSVEGVRPSSPFFSVLAAASIPVSGDPLEPRLVDAPGPLPIVPGPEVVGFRVAVDNPLDRAIGATQVVLVAPRSLDVADGAIGGDGWECRLSNGPYDAGAADGREDSDVAVCERPTLPPGASPLSVAWRLVGENLAEEGSGVADMTIAGVSGLGGEVTLRRELVTGSSPSITSGPPPAGVVGLPYLFTFTATGTPTPTWTGTGLPAGLVLDPSTGALSGTPTAPGTSPITVTAANGVSPDATATYDLTVEPARVAPGITSGPPPAGVAGLTYLFTFTATGTPTPTWTGTGLPAGLVLDRSTGALSGTPTAPGTSPITITAANGVTPDATVDYSITIAPRPAAAPALAFSPTVLDFGDQRVGATSPARVVTVTNTGTANFTTTATPVITNTTFSFDPSNREPQSCGNIRPAGRLTPGQSCTLALTFRPTATGPSTGTLILTGNGGNIIGGTWSLPLTGNGTAPNS